ncbi:MAG: RHS repeat protein, partial [Chloroflexia bacterium]|nr:RHS repeat protein [Chloroflexia bacterium]
YVRMLSQNAQYLARLGQRVDDITTLQAFSFRQADGLNPVSALARGVDGAVGAPGLPLVFERTYLQQISRRFEQSTLGYGWRHNWQYRMTTDAEGNVTITAPSGTPRLFQPDSRYSGRYLAQPGDRGSLRAVDGGFRVTEADGLIQFYRDGKLQYLEDRNGNRITVTYAGEQMTVLSHSAGGALNFTYNAGGQLAAVTDQDGRQTTYGYNGAYLTTLTTYDDRVITFTYETSGAAQHALSSIEQPDGVTRHFTYDTQGRLASSYRDAQQEQFSFTYAGGRVSMTDALNQTSRFFFDFWGRVAKTENALGETTLLAFNEIGQVVSVTDAAGISSSFSYDRNGNLTATTDALRRTTRFGYERTFNRLASVTDAAGNQTAYSYDARGNLTAMTYADASRETWSYDNQGNPLTWQNRRGNTIAYTYDASGRNTQKTYADTSAVTYRYDQRGNLIETVDAAGTTTYTYNEHEYLTRIDYPHDRWLSFTYNAVGRRATSTDHLGYVLSYTYDSAGRLSRVADATTDLVTYSYDTLGRLAQKTMGNGVVSTYTYDAAGRLQSLVNTKPDASELSRFVYTYDRRGRRVTMETHYGQWSYTYDDGGQVLRATLTSTDPAIANQDLRYEYDAVGNRVRTTINGVEEAYATNNLNQYITVGDQTYTYDLDGNLIRDEGPGGITVYTYNDENRLIGVTRGGDTWTYTYDAFGNRVAADENGAVTHFMLDPIGMGNLVGIYAANGDQLARYVHSDGLLQHWSATEGASYYTVDPLGNISEMTGAAGVVQNAYAYRPFGETVLRTETIANPFEFMGAFGVMADTHGLTAVRIRQYDPARGRFTAMDPLGIMAGDPNLYAYVANAPVDAFDPTGLRRICGVVQGSLNVVGSFGKMGAGVTLIVKSGGLAGWAGLGLLGSGIYDLGRGGMQTIYHVTMGIGERIVTFSEEDHMLDDAISNALEKGLPGAIVTIAGGESISGGVDKAADVGAMIISPTSIGLGDVALTGAQWIAPEFCAPNRDPIPPPNPPAGSGTRGAGGSAGSQDPNEKISVAGFGAGNFVRADTLVTYRIDFENYPDATAPAQVVTIRDPLSTDLDWNTLELTEFGFGNVILQ